MFYRANAFSFCGYHSWRPINLWLESSGSQNQKSLTDLEISMLQPMHVKPESDGTRVETVVSWSLARFEDVAQRQSRLVLSADLPVEGIVENINPAVEDLFKILGSNRPKLKISFLLTSGVCPGSEPSRHEEDQTSWGYWFSMDLPNLIEVFRVVYTTDRSRAPRVNIVWKVDLYKQQNAAGKHEIEAPGWKIMEENQWNGEIRFHHSPESNYDRPIVAITLKREGFKGEPVVAEGPYPYSYIRS